MSDYAGYQRLCYRQNVDKALKTLSGILLGILADGEVSANEIEFLKTWLKENREVSERPPYNEIFFSLEEFIAAPEISKEIREDILWLCQRINSEDIYYNAHTSSLQTLQGMLAGIVSDGKISETELRSLEKWLDSNDYLKNCYPYSEVSSLLTMVLQDGKIDENEHKILMEFFSEFILSDNHKVIQNPLVEIGGSITGLCAICPEIEFENKLFCFTGASRKYFRETLAQMVRKLGGEFNNRLSQMTDYLIIGDNGNPCWAFSCYGRKVEQAVQMRKEGIRSQNGENDIVLIHENDFLDAVQDHIDIKEFGPRKDEKKCPTSGSSGN